jgi:hypothetical protein
VKLLTRSSYLTVRVIELVPFTFTFAVFIFNCIRTGKENNASNMSRLAYRIAFKVMVGVTVVFSFDLICVLFNVALNATLSKEFHL